MSRQIRWLPLEANPDVMNKFVRGLGLDAPWSFVDVFGLDTDLLMMIPKPVGSVLLLFPLTDKTDSVTLGVETEAPSIYFMKQTISNACGTVGLIHAIGNSGAKEGLKAGYLTKFLDSTKDMTPEEKGKFLETDQGISEAHEASAQEGQTEAPNRDAAVDLHFVAFVHKDGGLFELDGRKSAPVRHGDTTPDTLLEDTADVIKKFMARDPENLNFTVVALAKAD